ncbi:MAG: hypothetical protein ACT4QD_16305 [Acidobacteriota bacterium]
MYWKISRGGRRCGRCRPCGRTERAHKGLGKLHKPQFSTAPTPITFCYKKNRNNEERCKCANLIVSTEGFTLLGWALAEEGRIEDGLAQIHEGIAGYRATGAELEMPYWLSLLAQAQGKAGQLEEGLRTLAEAMRRVQQYGVRICEAELHRLRGELLLQQAVPKDQRGAFGPLAPAVIHAPVMTEAAASFRDAIEIARRKQAKSLELRAVMSLSRLLQRQGQRDEACQMLGQIYGWFTEGFNTADLKDARALLDELS